MGPLKNEANTDVLAAGDLRRKRSRRLVEMIQEGSRHLPEAERFLLSAIFERGDSISKVARESAADPRRLSRQVHRITQRVLDPRFRFVAVHQSRWRPTRRKVAGACVLEGLSIREAAERLKLSPYTVRKHKEAIDALCEEIPSAGDIP
ncbi:MAG: response regulator transcription factor [Phycisphaera sp.]|nr:response regulator transcription factor [Phycisphaera sp.]